MSQAQTPSEVQQLSIDILDFIQAKFGRHIDAEQMDTIRCGLGLTLTAVHSSVIHSGSNAEEKKQGVHIALDSIRRLALALEGDVKKAGIEDVGFSIKEVVKEDIH